jgi:hypothetical protein
MWLAVAVAAVRLEGRTHACNNDEKKVRPY